MSMRAHKILIADKDPATRRQLAEFFEQSNYQVETTGSAAYVIAMIIRKHEPIVLLGDAFEETITAAEVVAILRGRNKNLRIILVADEDSPGALRRVREEGIFYHALKPISQRDNEELRSVVECAEGSLNPVLI